MARLALDEKKILLDEKKILLDEKKMLMDREKDREKMLMDREKDREKIIFIFVSVIIVGSVTLFFSVDRLAKAMVLSNASVSNKEIFLKDVEDMSKAISTGAARGLNHTIVGYPNWWFWKHPNNSWSNKFSTSNSRINEKEK
jgi:hypothetical protein